MTDEVTEADNPSHDPFSRSLKEAEREGFALEMILRAEPERYRAETWHDAWPLGKAVLPSLRD